MLKLLTKINLALISLYFQDSNGFILHERFEILNFTRRKKTRLCFRILVKLGEIKHMKQNELLNFLNNCRMFFYKRLGQNTCGTKKENFLSSLKVMQFESRKKNIVQCIL